MIPRSPTGDEPPDIEFVPTRSLISDLDAIVWEADARSMVFTFVSDGVQQILGYSPREWLAEPSFWADHLHPDDRQQAVSCFVRAASSGTRFESEYRIFAKDGSVVWLHDIGHVVKDVDGHPLLLRGLATEITERKSLEHQTVEIERRFRRVVERLPAIVYIERAETDPGKLGSLLYVSPQVERILGFTPAEWIADPAAWARQFYPGDRERIGKAHRRAEVTGEMLSTKYRMHARDGRVVWFRDESVLVRDEDGDPSYWQGIMYDMTSDRESERKVRQAETQYRTLVERLPAIVYSENVGRNELQLVYVNSRVQEILGVSPQEWINDPDAWLSMVHPDDRAMVEQANELADRSLEPFRIEYRMIARNGHVVWFRDEAVIVRDEVGEPAYWQGVMMDITATKEAESQRAEAEERYRVLIEQNPTITYIDAVEGPVTTLYISPQTTDVLGYTPQDWYDDPELWNEIVHADDRERSRVRSVDRLHDSVYRIVAKSGEIVWVHDQARLIADDEGRPKYWQGVLIDITEQKRAEELERDLAAEREAMERLRAADEMKNTFLQAVSHDLRTPLAAILGLAVTLEREDVDLDAEETQDMARRIAQNARKLDGIVTDLLDLDRLSRGILEPFLELVDVGALVRELVANFDVATGRTVRLHTEPVEIPADAAMVERMVENLLGNAAKHTPSDSRIWVSVEQAKGGASIVVADDGPGVPPDERERIFQAFRQGSEHAAGAGVGLALVSRFAELHDGRAWVEERDGGGASFHVFLSDDPAAGRQGGDRPQS